MQELDNLSHVKLSKVKVTATITFYNTFLTDEFQERDTLGREVLSAWAHAHVFNGEYKRVELTPEPVQEGEYFKDLNDYQIQFNGSEYVTTDKDKLEYRKEMFSTEQPISNVGFSRWFTHKMTGMTLTVIQYQ